ncbi:MAG: response regulator [Victivallales bacterium]
MIERLHILLVEDNPGDADLIRELLPVDGPDGVEIECVPRLSMALKCVKAVRFEIILLDLGLPDSQGIDTIRAMRRGAQDLPIVVLTGNQDEQIGLSAIREGAQDYLVKGLLDKNLLVRAIRYALERKRVEEALLKMSQEWQRTFDTMNVVIWILDKDNLVLRSNKAAELYFHRPLSEMVGKHCWEILHGTEQPIPECPVMRARKSLHHESLELQIGASWFDISVNPILDADGHFAGAVHVVADITERKLAEEEKAKLEAQLRQSQKMEAVGTLAGGVAHDFNNMLSVINGYSDMLLQEMSPSDPKYERIHEIYKAGMRSAELTQQLLAFARKQTIAPKVLDLNDAVTGMLKMLQRLIGENIELLWKPAASLWKVKMDPSQINQILANLIVNARDAISDAGKIMIETGKADLDAAFCGKHPDFIPGKYVVLEVSDNGCGMDRRTLEHIFEPFFTTKKVGAGTGLGLATVFGIVKQNGGFINVYSEPGKGTTFKIYLPRHDSAETDTEKEEKSKAAKMFAGTETVLLVEDEAALLLLARRMLEQLGYAVLVAGSPAQAVRIAGEYKGGIHLLMTDVVMPEMSGRDLKEKIYAMHPGIKCLFMSGYTAEVMSHNGILDEGIHFLEKPFTAKELSAKLREALA